MIFRNFFVVVNHGDAFDRVALILDMNVNLNRTL